MKNEISSLELHYLIKELQVIIGSKVDRIYNSKESSKELIISCHVTGKGKTMLKILLPSIIFLDDSKDSAGTPTGFSMMLRKYIEGGRIRNIEQKDFERVVVITVETKNSKNAGSSTQDSTKQYTYYIILELFSKGNVIFCDDAFKILNIVEEQAWKDRILKRQSTYIYPKSKSNILNIQENEFIDQLNSSGKDSIVKALAITFNLGGVYAEEICLLSCVEKDKHIKDINDKEYSELYKHLILLLHKETNANSFQDEIYPFILEKYKNSDLKKYETFSDAIRVNYDNIKHTDSKKDSTKYIEKIQKVIDEQKKQLQECEDGYKENQEKGEALYEKYQQISEILKTIKEARLKYSWNEIRKKLDENPDFKKTIKDIDEKNNSIIIELEK